MRSRIVTSIVAFLCLIACTRGSEASLASDIEWISSIPGVALATTVEKGGRVDNVYTVAGSTASALGAIRARLARDGWSVVNRAAVTTAAGSIRGIDARKGGRRIHVTAHEAAGIAGLTVQYLVAGGASHGQAPPPTRDGDEEPPVTGGPVTTSAGDVTINDGHTRQTYRMDGGTLTVNSSHNTLVVTGRCQAIVLNGGHNKLDIRATVPRVQLNASWNKIQWSRSKNPRQPAITDWGSENLVTPSE